MEDGGKAGEKVPRGAVWVPGAQCPDSLTEQKASSPGEGYQVRALI